MSTVAGSPVPSFGTAGSSASDCNGNGVPDDQETEPEFSTTLLDASVDGAQSVALADLDGDGDLDVLAASEDDGTIAWYANLGAGNFGSRRILNAGAYGANHAIAVDLDSDGDLDVVSSAKAYPENVLWYENLDGAGTFGVKKPVGGAQNSRALTAADLDGDGDLDILSAQFFTNKVVWFENAGGPVSFVAEHSIAGIETVDPNTVSVGDLDGDDDPDLITASQKTGSISWFRNSDGNGNFVLAETLDSAVLVPRSVQTGDIDGDGDLDVLSASWRDGTVAWYENEDGNGTFGPERVISAAVSGAQVAIAVDLDNDGDLDVAIAAATGSSGPGDNSTCCGPTSVPWCSDNECPLTVCAEIDGFCCDVVWDQVCANYAKADPDCSVACGGGAGRVAWFENLDGDGSFGPFRLIVSIEGAFDVASGDLDGDGSADLVSAAYVDDKLLVHVNLIDDCNGNHVPDECDIAVGEETDSDCNDLPDSCEIDGGGAPDCNGNSVADACDLEGGVSADCAADGTPDECEPDCNENGAADSCDVAGGMPDANANGIPDTCDSDCNGNGVTDDLDISVSGMPDCDGNAVPDGCEPDCDGNALADACDTEVAFSVHVVSTTALSFSSGFDTLAVDIDGDGDQDIVFANGTDRVAWHENLDGQGSFGPEQLISSTQDDPKAVFGADVDGDGDVDVLAVSDSGGTLAWYENLDGEGSFGPERVIASGGGDVVAADVDGDDDVDVVSSNGSVNKTVLQRNLDGTGQLWSEEIILGQAGTSSLQLADIDGDGDLDLVVGNFSKIGWSENLNGSGAFGPMQTLVVPDSGPTAGVMSVVLADLVGGGKPDILFHTLTSIAWYHNLGRGLGFDLPSVITAEPKVRSVFAADLDGDHDEDVIFGSTGLSVPEYLGQVGWIENLGLGQFGPEQPLPIGTPPKTAVVSAADFDGDGDVDVLGLVDFVGSQDSVVWWENLSNDCNGNRAPDVCEADCDADGLIDICALDTGVAVDCNSNDVPDGCDTGCSVACDADGDRCQDVFDLEPLNPGACADTDVDGCDDCAGGAFSPGADGIDADADGFCSTGDCSDGDATIWAPSSDTGPLKLSRSGVGTALGWQPPATPGATAVRYDTLHSDTPWNFFGLTACVESDGADLTSFDSAAPDPGGVLFYLVRVENACPGTDGNMGASSDGTARTGAACP